MLPRNHPDRIRIAFDDTRLVGNAGLILPATLARHLPANRNVPQTRARPASEPPSAYQPAAPGIQAPLGQDLGNLRSRPSPPGAALLGASQRRGRNNNATHIMNCKRRR